MEKALGLSLKKKLLCSPADSNYEVCPKSSWTSLLEVLDKHISLKAFAFHEVQHQLNKWSKFHEN